MSIRWTIAAIGLILAIPLARAAPVVVVKPYNSQLGSPEAKECAFLGDAMYVDVKDGKKLLLRYDFCSAYGEASARLVTDSLQRMYLLLEYGRGHGTSVTTKYLAVYRLENRDVTELLRLPIDWWVSASGKFTYEYTALPDRSGGIQIDLYGTVSGRKSDCCVPPERNLVVRIDPRGQ